MKQSRHVMYSQYNNTFNKTIKSIKILTHICPCGRLLMFECQRRREDYTHARVGRSLP